MCVFVGLQSTTRFVILNPIALFIYVFTSILRVSKRCMKNIRYVYIKPFRVVKYNMDNQQSRQTNMYWLKS